MKSDEETTARSSRSLVSRAASLAGLALVLSLASPSRAQNLLPDPRFTEGIGGFVPIPPATMQRSSGPGSDGAPGFGILRMLGPGSAVAGVCVPVVGGRTYSWGATLIPRRAASFVSLSFFANGACQGTSVLALVFGPSNLDPDRWKLQPSPDVTAPTGAASVQFNLISMIGGNETGGLDVDDVYFGPQGTASPGPQNVPAITSPAALLLAALLSVAALRFLR